MPVPHGPLTHDVASIAGTSVWPSHHGVSHRDPPIVPSILASKSSERARDAIGPSACDVSTSSLKQAGAHAAWMAQEPAVDSAPSFDSESFCAAFNAS